MLIKIKGNYIKLFENYFLIFVMLSFYIGLLFNISWKISWFLLFLFSIYIITKSILDTFKGQVVYDKLLFILGLFVFVIYEPTTLILENIGFPNINNTYIKDNYLANFVGFVTVVYIMSFYFGHYIVKGVYRIKKDFLELSIKTDDLKIYLLVMYFFLSVLPFLVFGSSSIVENFFYNLNARSNGYVAFASSGLGSKNPVISLLAQAIPATIILIAIYMDKISNYKKILALIFMLFIFFLYISLGGRSGVIFVFMTIIIFWYHRRKNQSVPIIKIVLILILVFSSITYQINSRDTGSFKSVDRSGLTGFELNREITFIVDQYGEKRNFISANTLIEKLTLPLLDTVYLFVTNPIPRMLWKSKPIDESFAPFNKLRTGKTGFSHGSNITPTIIGRYYMKYGLLGVIEIGIFIGILWTIANIYIKLNLNRSKLELVMPIAFVATLFSTTRDFAPGKFYPFLFIYLFYILNKIEYKKW